MLNQNRWQFFYIDKLIFLELPLNHNLGINLGNLLNSTYLLRKNRLQLVTNLRFNIFIVFFFKIGGNVCNVLCYRRFNSSYFMTPAYETSNIHVFYSLIVIIYLRSALASSCGSRGLSPTSTWCDTIYLHIYYALLVTLGHPRRLSVYKQRRI